MFPIRVRILRSAPASLTGRRDRLLSRNEMIESGPPAIASGRVAARGFVTAVAVLAPLGALALLGWTFAVAHVDRIRALSGEGGVLFWRLSLAVAVIVAAGWIAGLAVERIGQPRVIGEIFMGILLGPTFLGQFAPDLQQYVFTPVLVPYLSGIASVGVAMFMFLVGAEVSFGLLRATRWTVGLIGFSMVAIPFVCGVLVAVLLAGRYRPEAANPLAFMLFTGVAMGVTAFPVLARILREKGLIGSRLGTLGLVSAGVGDVLAWCLLAVTIAVIRGTSPVGVVRTIALLALFVSGALLLRPVLRRFFARVEMRRGGRLVAIAVVLLLGVSFAWFTEAAGLHAIFGAFLAGAILPRGRRRSRR